jgi:hypothetical protein
LAIGLLLMALLLTVPGASAYAAASKARLGKFCTPNGTTAGQCRTVRSIAVNVTGSGEVPVGSVYVVDATNNRIQRFSSAGAFVSAFGLGVDQSTGGNVCTAESGDICKAGTASAAAGSVNQAYGIAIDQNTGAVYVSSKANRRIDVFSAAGVFEGAIGWNVNSSTPAEELELCTAASGCKAGIAGSAAGQFSSLEAAGLAVDPRDGNLYVSDLGNLRLAEYAINVNAGGEVAGATFVHAIGWNVNAAAPAEELQICTALTGCQKGTLGGGAGQFFKFNPGPIAVDSAGNIYAPDVSYSASCSPTEPCRVLKFNPDGSFKEAFGPISGECQLAYTTGTAKNEEAVAVAVDPVLADHDNRVYVTKKTAAGEYRVFEFDEDGDSCAPSPAPGSPALLGSSIENAGLAIGTGGRLYVGNAASGGGEVVILGEAPAPTVEFGQVTEVGPESVKVSGSVTPPEAVEGNTFETTWHFEYSTDQAHWTRVPALDLSAGAVPDVSVPVEWAFTGLTPHTAYFARLCASTGPTVCDPSPPLEFVTGSIAPTAAPFSAEVTQTEATLGAEIKPNNLASKYHIEWASQAEWEHSPGTYGHRLPSQDRQIGTGLESVIVREQLVGLASASLYHFKIVATNAAGTSASPDQEVETLDSCGMTDDRCFELVSRADKGPVASPGKRMSSALQPQFQPALAGSALAYTVEGGYPDATVGDEAVYLARRGGDGWASEQVTPPTLRPPTLSSTSGANGGVKVLSPDLGCAVVVSVAPLVADAPATVVEAGGANLYRRDDVDGSYEVITPLPPVNADGVGGSLVDSEYQIIGTSADCRRVVFRTAYRYLGVPAVSGAKYQLYEWDHGTIRNAAVIPGTGGTAEPVPAESVPGALDESPDSIGEPIGAKGPTDYRRAVSTDGTRSIFTAVSRFGADAGRRAVFLRDAGDPAVLAGTAPATDVSQSETATPDDGNSRYWIASTDGTRVFFTARYGLAENGSSSGATSCANVPSGGASQGSGEGCDLYEYDLERPAGERLTDLSPDITDAKGAGVVGVLDASEDGTYVYFASRGRLGAVGNTEAESLTSGAYNIYLAHAGRLRLVGTLGQAEAIGTGDRALVNEASWTSRASGGGSKFVFETSLGGPAGAPMVYLYSADDTTRICVSCRHDGQAPFSPQILIPLATASEAHAPIVLTDGGRLYFYSADPLATGAVEGSRNLYQWEHGQVSLIASEPAGVPRSLDKVGGTNFFGGASADGGDVYFTSPERLAGPDQDERWDVYDARIGGGFPESPETAPCDATVEDACNAGGAGLTTQAAPATSAFAGPSNASPQKQRPRHKKKHRAKKRGHKANKKKKKHRKTDGARRANTDRRAAK